MKAIVTFEAEFMAYEDLVLEVKQRIQFLKTQFLELGDSEDIPDLALTAQKLDLFIEYREASPNNYNVEKVAYHQLQELEPNQARFTDMAPWSLYAVEFPSVSYSDDLTLSLNGQQVSASFPRSRDFILWRFVEVGLAELTKGQGV